MITERDAALRAELIIEYPAGDPEQGWTLTEFPQGWLVDWHGWKGPPGQFHIVIVRRTGLVRYFTAVMPAEAIISEYPAICDEGRPDYRWEATALPPPRTRPREPSITPTVRGGNRCTGAGRRKPKHPRGAGAPPGPPARGAWGTAR